MKTKTRTGMKTEGTLRKTAARFFALAMITAAGLCFGCGTDTATDAGVDAVAEDAGGSDTDSASGNAAETKEAKLEEDAREVPDDGKEESAKEQAEETEKSYNTEIGVIDFTYELYQSGCKEICILDGDSYTTTYYSVEDGNSYTFPYMDLYNPSFAIYVPARPISYTCDYPAIDLYYPPDSFSDGEERGKYNIFVMCPNYFAGENVPINFKVEFEDGSTQEITGFFSRRIPEIGDYLQAVADDEYADEGDKEEVKVSEAIVDYCNGLYESGYDELCLLDADTEQIIYNSASEEGSLTFTETNHAIYMYVPSELGICNLEYDFGEGFEFKVSAGTVALSPIREAYLVSVEDKYYIYCIAVFSPSKMYEDPYGYFEDSDCVIKDASITFTAESITGDVQKEVTGTFTWE